MSTPVPDPAPPAEPARAGGIPGGRRQGVWLLVGLAAATITAFGMAGIGSILAPVLLALVLTICVHPVRRWLEKHGTPRGLATGSVVLVVFVLLAAFVVVLVIAFAQFATMLPRYASQLAQLGQQLGDWLAGIGIGQQQVQQIVSGFDPSQLLTVITGFLGGAFSIVTSLVIVLTMLILMAADAGYAPTVLRQLGGTKPELVRALNGFAGGVRRYMVVTTVLGVVQGVINGVALWLLGVPAALLWAMLSFLCSFIPNVGYFIAIIPPLVFGYFTGGWGTVIAIIVIYGLINAVVQSIIQPKVVGNAVALSQTLTFFSVLFWAIVIGPIGAILAVPLTLLVRAVLVDADPGASAWRPAIGDLAGTKAIMKEETAARKAARHPDPAPPE
ncbi:AI-2E family transporter [Leifsonia poae]|uniref:AI-2E family transporter n=1 Tax=Leifsonia poae TaxID=110933 RepID=UPI001CBB99AE|nr:AI-2E family transporter [Leifsonia poae]